MTTTAFSLRGLSSFGDVAAEDDSVLDYFLATSAVEALLRNERFLVLGRKGSGKTALVRYFSETPNLPTPSRALKLRAYPWGVHVSRKDLGASDIEAYVASWRYMISCELALLVIDLCPDNSIKELAALRKFFNDNYGSTSPALNLLIRASRLRITSGSLEPEVFGVKLGSIDFDRGPGDSKFGLEVNALSNSILDAIRRVTQQRGIPTLLLHFDELDQGLSELDRQREHMLTGLVLAARDVRTYCADSYCRINPIVYLRTDLWESLEFSDKNKVTQTSTLHLEWDKQQLQELIDRRIQARLSPEARWDDIEDGEAMRGSQSKWNHILTRTFLRPRDAIRFMNAALYQAKRRSSEPLLLTNKDITNAREEYSKYLKEELDDEITPHWKNWDRALQTLAAISTITFEKPQFESEYSQQQGPDEKDFESALETLYRFSVIGYERRSGYGGSSWAFQYTHPEAGWDKSATRFKVHLGLKEFAKLREERA